MNVKDNIVPCGKCFECKRNDRNGWAIRLQHEIKSGTFVTLTYDEEHLPKDGKLIKKDLQDYIKRVREQLRYENPSFRLLYFGVGEYGERYGRPHYHIITNCSNIDTLKSKWNKGITDFGIVEEASILYCTKYIQKQKKYKKDTEQTPYKTKKGDKTRHKAEKTEFRIMSKGLGNTYIEKYKDYLRENLITYTSVRGVKYPLPRYYRDKIFNVQTETKINKETGEITKTITQEKVDLREVQDKNIEVKLKKLIKLYGKMLKSEISPQAEKYYNKYNEMLNSLKHNKI